MDIYPTKKCFDDALEFIEELITAQPDKKDEIIENILVIHGICLLPDGEPYAHAWVEDKRTDDCIFRGIIDGEVVQLQADGPGFYEKFKVQEQTKYTLRMVHDHNIKHGTYGPWEKKYMALTRQGKATPEVYCLTPLNDE